MTIRLFLISQFLPVLPVSRCLPVIVLLCHLRSVPDIPQIPALPPGP